ncbi:ATP-dependent helicase [Bacillus spizizenii]|uniref:UvrD-helicase domain-containing protein n=1 Tax=Bacillus spizizenii TaxID=96241 RepID=UPI00165ABA65|nr:ATP-dependent helicase [Bacillus spizizenii]MCY7810697.1 ATP-dependent helicase [Bacillus spizizenii]MCY7882446.1 ATP-dependent helicase [Bacillus spizizenii]MCY7889376.1 ATP-dependent helicase [Bacillus spizizenii]MCY8325694.1 ATP-dependent helicase [Bacillus spizizenii]MCY8654549.1 ATP-dependent helicase [Bacillus spizizenii]
MSDQSLREKIILDDSSAIISAGAGSGKTHILVTKILHEIKTNRTHYKIAAITFTKKAANEIMGRLGGKLDGNFIGTNDSFIENEIIKPFIKDVFGIEFPNEYEVVYSREYKFRKFEDGLTNLKNNYRLGTYFNNKENFKFQLALKILGNSKAAKQYIKAKYSRMYIDEYQDCDKDMHQLFMFIHNQLGVKLFLVGDPKQSIYEWRGAKPSLFISLFEGVNDLNKYRLTENFRCCQEIRNYSNIFLKETQDLYEELKEEQERVLGIIGENLSVEFFDTNKEIAVLVRTNKEARDICKLLNEDGYNFVFVPRTPLDELGTQNAGLYIELAKYSKNNRYSIYDFINEIPRAVSGKQVKEIERIINPLKNIGLTEEIIEDIIINLFAILDITIDIKELRAFLTVILTTDYDIAYNGDNFLHRVMTIHSAKGLEFDQVMIFGSNYNVQSGSDLNEHYVAVTRGKEKLVVVIDSHNYFTYLKNLVASLSLSLKKIIKIINL